ncbi:hypothetical protein [Sphingomonas sp.]|uniref:hypothetical protein n=1 Tax=Sphingomonas sp. TaxID=28214 RepID=UPI003CC548A0
MPDDAMGCDPLRRNPVRPLDRVNGAAADDRPAACAGTKFRQSHSDGHTLISSQLAPGPTTDRIGRNAGLLGQQAETKR